MFKTRDREVFRHLANRDPRRASAADNKTLEAINIYEGQREEMRQEIDELQLEVNSAPSC